MEDRKTRNAIFILRKLKERSVESQKILYRLQKGVRRNRVKNHRKPLFGTRKQLSEWQIVNQKQEG